MHELVDVLMTTDGGENMAQTLMKFTEGSYAGLFDKQTNVELENQLVVFQIRDLEDALRPVAMYVVLNFLWNRIRADMKRRFLVIDEAWNLMQYDDSAKFLYGLIKRARKYYLGVTTITQDVEDFVNSPYGKPIVTNAQLQILLKQSPTAVDNLQKLFYLTDGEKYLLLNSEVGQGLFFAGNKHVAIQVVASPEESEVITTKPEEVLAAKKEKDEAVRTAEKAKEPEKEEPESKQEDEKTVKHGKPPEQKLNAQEEFKLEAKKKKLAVALGHHPQKTMEENPIVEAKAPRRASSGTDKEAELIQKQMEEEQTAKAERTEGGKETMPSRGEVAGKGTQKEQPANSPATGRSPDLQTAEKDMQEEALEDPFDAIDPMDEEDTTIPPPKETQEKPAVPTKLSVQTALPPSAPVKDEPLPEDPFDAIDPVDNTPAPTARSAGVLSEPKKTAAPIAEKSKENTILKKRKEEEPEEEKLDQ